MCKKCVAYSIENKIFLIYKNVKTKNKLFRLVVVVLYFSERKYFKIFYAFYLDDSFEKTFAISLDLYGISTGTVVKILNTSNKRSRHLKCQGECEPFTVLHLGFIDFAKYFIVVRFSDLKGVHERYHIKDVHFYVRYLFISS